MLYERLAVIGIGLIGGSFALAARRRGLVGHVVGCGRSAATRDGALSVGAADEVTDDPACAVRDADLVYLAVPVGSMADAMARIAPALKPGALVTDAGSTKRTIMQAAGEHLAGHAFLGGHPIAGAETAGVLAAREDLFEGRTYVLTPSGSVPAPQIERFAKLVCGLGARLVSLDAESHDRCVAITSHLPHLSAAALAATVAGTACDDTSRGLIGTGFADSTRVAGGAAELWRDIFAANADNVRAALAVLRAQLEAFDAALAAQDWDAVTELLEAGRRGREELMRR